MKRGMQGLALGLLGMWLAGCSAVPHYPIDEQPRHPQPSPQADSWTTSVKPEVRQDEAAKLAQYPNVAKRNGNILTLYSHGRRIATRVSTPDKCAGFNTCELWLFDGVIVLRDPLGGGLEVYPQLSFDHGEGGDESVIQLDGKDYRINAFGVASPDGTWIAAGKAEVDDMSDSNALTLYDWTGKVKPVAFKASCGEILWRGNDAFTASCMMYEPGQAVRFDGSASRDAQGQWHLSQTRLYDAEGKPIAGTDKLQTFDASPIAN